MNKNTKIKFNSFFTMKPAKHGSGLRLSLSCDILNAHSGEIKDDGEEREGTDFTIQLPFVKAYGRKIRVHPIDSNSLKLIIYPPL